MKKKTVIIVVSILVVLLIVAGVLAYLMLGTDVFKSSKELFAKYSTQVVAEDGFFPTALKDYETKKDMVAYTSDGTLSADTEIKGDVTTDATLQDMQNAIGYANNTNITFNGKVDKTNRKVEESFVVNYTDTVKLPFTVKQVGDRYGLLVNGVSETNYIAIDNNNLPGLLQSTFGVTNTTGVPNKLEMPDIESLNFTEEEKTHINDTYFTPVFDSITEDKFTKVKNEDGTTSYVLEMSADEFKNILSQMLQILSTDTTMINKFNTIFNELETDLSLTQAGANSSYLSSYYGTTSGDTVTAENILNLKNELDAQTWNGTIKLTATESKRVTTKFAVELNGVEIIQNNNTSNSLTTNYDASTSNSEIPQNVLFEVSKVQTGTANIDYTVNAALNGTSVFTANVGYADLNTNNPKETVTATIGDPNYLTTTYSYNKNITFGNEVVIDEFNDSTTFVINDYPSNQIGLLLMQYIGGFMQLNTNLMTQIGYQAEDVNPLLVWVAAPSISLSQMNIVNQSNDVVANTSLSEQESRSI